MKKLHTTIKRQWRPGVMDAGVALLLCAAILGPDRVAGAQDKTDATRAEYDAFVAAFTQRPRASQAKDAANLERLILTTTGGDEPKPQPPRPAFLFNTGISYQCVVSDDGRVTTRRSGLLGTGGFSLPTLSASDLRRLNQLLTQLPDDGSHLPPPGRRLVVQVPEGERYRVRVYDLANAPDQILEICRITASGIGSWSPTFQPATQWQTGEGVPSVLGILSLTPDHQQIITTEWRRPLKFWHPDTHQLVKALPDPIGATTTRLVFSPDGSLAATDGGGFVSLLETKTWHKIRTFEEAAIRTSQYKFSFPQFTPDGQFLVIRSSQNTLRIFDTRTGESRETLPGLPTDALSYVPLAGTNRALYNSRDDALALWDTQQHHDRAKLATNARLEQVALSPDKSLVAIATASQSLRQPTAYRIRIWKVATGELVHELRPFERNTCGVVGALLWSPDSHYLVAACDPSVWEVNRIVVWSLQSGRQRGEFASGIQGSTYGIKGLALLPDGRLVAGSDDGLIRMWNATEAFKAIGTFEKSLSTVQ